MPPNRGLIIEAPSETDYVAGDGNLTGVVINPIGDWTPYIPSFEHQAPTYETNSCASHGTLNAFETIHKFIFGEELNLSDRMLAKGSGTDPARGNTPQKVAEWFRKNWSVFDEDWSMKDAKDVKDYYRELPDLLFSKAQIVKAENKWGYEAITNPTKLKLQDALTKGVVCMSVSLMIDENGLYFKPAGWRDAHWVQLLRIKPNGNYVIFDSYDPSIKEIRADFIPEIAYRYTLNEEAVDFITQAIAWIKSWIAKQPKPQPKPAPANNVLNELCLAIQKHEGWHPGSRSQRNNNPGNCRYSSVGYLPIYGVVKKDPDNFAIFKDYATGFLYLKNLIKEKARTNPSWTLYDLFREYAPAEDHNDPVHYARVVANAIRVDVETWRISSLL